MMGEAIGRGSLLVHRDFRTARINIQAKPGRLHGSRAPAERIFWETACLLHSGRSPGSFTLASSFYSTQRLAVPGKSAGLLHKSFQR
jgi:hypothetical protein